MMVDELQLRFVEARHWWPHLGGELCKITKQEFSSTKLRETESRILSPDPVGYHDRTKRKHVPYHRANPEGK
jgi:hypothetical protein